MLLITDVRVAHQVAKSLYVFMSLVTWLSSWRRSEEMCTNW